MMNMKFKRKQTVGKIQFIIESNFEKEKAISTKELLSKIMINKADEALNKIKEPIPQN